MVFAIVGAPVFPIPTNSTATLSERISGMMTPRRRNSRLRSQNFSFGDTAEEDFPTHGTRMLSENTRKSFQRVLKSWESFLQLAACVIAVSLDPLFLYIPVINDHEKCFQFDKKLRMTALILRSVTDIIFMLHIAFQFHTRYVARLISYNVNGVNEIVASSWETPKTYMLSYWEIPKRYMLSYFLIDILSLLPLPQVVILSIIPEMKGSKSLIAKNILIALALSQYVPRVVRIYPLYKKLTWTPRIFKGTLWTKAAFNLFFYMLASHVLGALWYFFSIEREITCWQEACEGHPGCDHSSFFCDDGIRATEFLHDMCPIDTPNTNLFDFGIFLDALQSGIVESVNFPKKFFRCLWWGLQNLSSLGQNLKTSTNVWENIFAVFISTSGLVLFLYFIGNMQTYMQLKTVKKEEKRMEIRSKEEALDSWMSTNLLPERIKSRIKHSVEKKWHEISTVDSENLIPILPVDLQKDIKRFLCHDLVMRVPEFRSMDYQLLDAMCGSLKPVFYSTECYIVRKGDPVKEMCFIFRGKVLSSSTTRNAGMTNVHNSIKLQTGDFCGEELLTWAFCVSPPANFPVSDRTAQALTEVEAFVLTAEDLKVSISQFWLQHPVNLHHIFRFYSPQWRTWAAFFIQTAWRRYAKRKLEESLREEENRLQDALAQTCGTTSIGATFYVSRFTANALGLIRGRKAKAAKRIPSMHLQKPAEPDFPGEGSS